jgi:hypothetical protein
MRHPKRSESRPPTGALAQAITPRPVRPLDITLAPSAGAYRSRTMARAHITPAPMATPCTARQTMSCSMVGENALAIEAAT